MDSANFLEPMVATIVKEVAPCKVILFGSHATGTAIPESDIDLLVIEKEGFGNGRSRRREIGRLLRLLMPFNITKDILVYTEDEVRELGGLKNHVVHRAITTGRVVYEKAF